MGTTTILTRTTYHQSINNETAHHVVDTPARAMLRQEEDGYCCRPVQGWQGPHQGLRAPPSLFRFLKMAWSIKTQQCQMCLRRKMCSLTLNSMKLTSIKLHGLCKKR